MIAKISATFPHTSIDISIRAVALPMLVVYTVCRVGEGYTLRGIRKRVCLIIQIKERVLISGYALSTVRQEFFMSVDSQNENISGPPKYFNIDWKVAENSVKQLKDLKPLLLIPGHGQPMRGKNWYIIYKN